MSSPTEGKAAAAPSAAPSTKSTLQEVLPKAGLVYSEKGNLSEVSRWQLKFH